MHQQNSPIAGGGRGAGVIMRLYTLISEADEGFWLDATGIKA